MDRMPKPMTVGPLTTTRSETLFWVNATLFNTALITPAYSEPASLSVVSTPKAEALPSQQRFYVDLSIVNTGVSLEWGGVWGGGGGGQGCIRREGT